MLKQGVMGNENAITVMSILDKKYSFYTVPVPPLVCEFIGERWDAIKNGRIKREKNRDN